ncbi:MAG: ribosome silencing factor [Propionibacteriaceae bacterium]|nr:ribosome silencing factor [Propionibacteriaceae bacterium]
MTATEEAIRPVNVAAQAAADKFGTSIVAFDVSDQLTITDIFLVATGKNERQVSSIVDGVEEALHHIGRKAARREGDRENRWVLLDYIDFVVHVQHTEERSLYNLERLWKDCPQIPLDVVLPEQDADAEEL